MSNVIRLLCVTLVLAVACVGPHSMGAEAGEFSRLQVEDVARDADHLGGAGVTTSRCHDTKNVEPVVTDRHAGGCEDCGLCVQKATRVGCQSREFQAFQLEVAQSFLALASIDRFWTEVSTGIEASGKYLSLLSERSANAGARREVLLTTRRIRI